MFSDFFLYKSGIYHHTSNKAAGSHAVKIIGWGVEAGVNFWIVANSWGTKWGEDGFFRIKEDEGGINGKTTACTPALSYGEDD